MKEVEVGLIPGEVVEQRPETQRKSLHFREGERKTHLSEDCAYNSVAVDASLRAILLGNAGREESYSGVDTLHFADADARCRLYGDSNIHITGFWANASMTLGSFRNERRGLLQCVFMNLKQLTI